MMILKDTIRKDGQAIALWAIFSLAGLSVFCLYGISLEPLFYASGLGLFFLLVCLAVDYAKEKRRSAERRVILQAIAVDRTGLPEPSSAAELDYQKMLLRLGEELDRLTAEFGEERRDSVDYYTAWVHQIKTPIAVMRLKLSEDTEENRALSEELFRIEQYADMALQYIRLGSQSRDLVVREYSLDELIKESVRKFAPLFVGKKLLLDYRPAGQSLITDRKWFACILEQLISNAIKYTPAGSVSIALEEGFLEISDSGIGIAPEDLPRIFEKGYTGLNGRIGEKSSGLGLYLAKKAADLLNIPLSVESRAGEGSCFRLDLREKLRKTGGK